MYDLFTEPPRSERQGLRVQTYNKIAQYKTDNTCQDKYPGQEAFLFEKQKNTKANKECGKNEQLDNHLTVVSKSNR
jgi:hypothetical protein